MLAVTNPLPPAGGADAQTAAVGAARSAPQAFRAVQFRAVLPDDYAAAAETLPWVQRAGTVFRWTGSWLTVFTTPDPLAARQITVDERPQLIDLLNRYRMAGYESYVPDPDYVSIDLIVEVCAQADAFAAGRAASHGVAVARRRLPATGFFAPDNFTFGQPLERSALEAAIQAVPGVAGVTLHPVPACAAASLGFVAMGDDGHGRRRPDHPLRQRSEPAGATARSRWSSGGQMSCRDSTDPICPCGVFVFPPAITNPPGLATIAYRVGDYTGFRHALLQPLPARPS